MNIAERFEDMSPRGRLRVLQQDDGDMSVAVIEDLQSGSLCAGLMASVEFCNSGGKSPRTLDALRALMMAMAEDNAAKASCSRRGETGLGATEPIRVSRPMLAPSVAPPGKAEPAAVGWWQGGRLHQEQPQGVSYAVCLKVEAERDKMRALAEQRERIDRALSQLQTTLDVLRVRQGDRAAAIADIALALDDMKILAAPSTDETAGG